MTTKVPKGHINVKHGEKKEKNNKTSIKACSVYSPHAKTLQDNATQLNQEDY